MIEEEVHEEGIITNIDNEKVIITRSNTHVCTSCKIKGLCNLYKQPEITVFTKEKFNIGDTIVMIINPNTRILSSFIVFILPLLILFITYFISANLFKQTDEISIVISFLSLILSFFIITKINSKYSKKFDITIKKKEN